MKKYYLMAIDKGSIDAIYNMGLYYQEIKDFESMLKYFVLCYQNNDTRPNDILIKYLK